LFDESIAAAIAEGCRAIRPDNRTIFAVDANNRRHGDRLAVGLPFSVAYSPLTWWADG